MRRKDPDPKRNAPPGQEEREAPEAKRRLLIADDDETVLYTLKTLLTRKGYEVHTAASGTEALGRFRERPDDFPVVLTDYQMEDMNGLALLSRLKEIRPDTKVIMITAHGSERVAVDAMKLGALDYFAKPFVNEELLLKIDLAFAGCGEGPPRGERKEPCVRAFGPFESDHPAMHLLFDKIRRVARSEVTVLVTGESGTGKELVARSIHDHGPRKEAPFVALNCAAIPSELLENELFGHEKGAYTGANERSRGKFEAASGGTLFLDEIGDMPMPTQAKVLRAIQEKTIERVGGGTPIKVDVRILAATHKDLNRLIGEGKFREDLYYRINVINLHLPPLRERPEDIPLLAARFLRDLNARMGRPVERFTEGALGYLKGYPWPGNVRQLQNTVERILVLTDRTVIDEEEARTLGELVPAKPSPAGEGAEEGNAAFSYELLDLDYREAQREVMRNFDRQYIEEALRRNNCNISRTAQKIGVHRTFLYDRIRELNINVSKLKYEAKNDVE